MTENEGPGECQDVILYGRVFAEMDRSAVNPGK